MPPPDPGTVTPEEICDWLNDNQPMWLRVAWLSVSNEKLRVALAAATAPEPDTEEDIPDDEEAPD